jgi:hypothetical protein
MQCIVIEGLGICRGKVMGEPCAQHSECDVALACRREWSWPYKTICRNYGQIDEFCDSDHDCQVKAVCVYEKESDKVKKCKLRHSAIDNTAFGWEGIEGKSMIDLSIYNGRFCKSGFAYKDSKSNEALCLSIRTIRS